MTDIKRLANKINSYFVGLTDHFPPLCQGVPPLSVPDEILISEYEAYKSLSSLQTSKAVGPDNKPNRILKDFALELAPLVCGIYSQSLREGYIPALLKFDLIDYSITARTGRSWKRALNIIYPEAESYS